MRNEPIRKPCPGREEHGLELYKTTREEHIYECFFCGERVIVPLDMKPEDATKGENK